MSNTALYQCEDCGYSTNNPVAFAIHPCRPSNGVNWNSRMFAVIIAAAIIALATLTPVNADSTQPPSVGEPPSVAVEHKVYMPFVASDNGVKAAVSWCPSCSPR